MPTPKEERRKLLKRLKRLSYSPFKLKEKQALKLKLLKLENNSFSQPINRFRVKTVKFSKLEKKHLGYHKHLSLEGVRLTQRDFRPIRTTRF